MRELNRVATAINRRRSIRNSALCTFVLGPEKTTIFFEKMQELDPLRLLRNTVIHCFKVSTTLGMLPQYYSAGWS